MSKGCEHVPPDLCGRVMTTRTLVPDHQFVSERHSPVRTGSASSAWRRTRLGITVAMFSLATVLGVGVGLHGATTSPVAPAVSGAAAPAATSPGSTLVVTPDGAGAPVAGGGGPGNGGGGGGHGGGGGGHGGDGGGGGGGGR